MLPEQVIPESQKTQEWRKNTCMAIIRAASASDVQRSKDLHYWALFHNIYDDKKFDYLRKATFEVIGKDGLPTGEKKAYDFPAKIRHFPLQRKYINLLLSKQARRKPFYSVTADDTLSVQKKYFNILQSILSFIDAQLKVKQQTLNTNLTEIKRQKQELEVMLQQRPETEEQRKAIEYVSKIKPTLDTYLTFMESKLKSEKIMTDEEVRKLAHYYRYEYKDFVEQVAQKVLKRLFKVYKIEQKSLKNFISWVVTGKQYYFVRHMQGARRPEFEALNTFKVYFPQDESVDYVQYGQWVAIKEYLTISQILDTYGAELKADEIKTLKSLSPRMTDFEKAQFLATSTDGAILVTNQPYAGVQQPTGIAVWKVFWRSPRKVHIKKTPRETAPGIENFFTHILSEQELHEKHRNRIKPEKREKLEIRYVDDIYCGIIIGDNIFIDRGIEECVLRPEDNPSVALLPVIGPTFSSFTNKPYSLIAVTEDANELYAIINYHKELLLAASGVRGQVINLSLIPEDMTPEEHRYYKKLGAYYVETVKKTGGRPLDMTFNQYTNFDDSVPPVIQFFDVMLNNLDVTIGLLMGITPAAMGQVVTPVEHAKTFQLSQEQTSLITEIIFAENDEILRQAVEALLNLTLKYCWKEGIMLELHDKAEGLEFVNIPPNLFAETDLAVHLEHSLKDEADLAQLKTAIITRVMNNLEPFTHLLQAYRAENLLELENKLEQYHAELEEIMKERATEQTAQNEKLIRIQSELEQQIKAQELQIKAYNVKLKEADMLLHHEINRLGLEHKMRKDEMREKMKLIQLTDRKETEMAVLDEQKRSNMVTEQLKSLELQMKSVLEQLKIIGNMPKKEKVET